MIQDRIRIFEISLLKAGILFFFLFLFGNILILDILFIQNLKAKAIVSSLETEKIPSDESNPGSENQGLCPASCISEIRQASLSSEQRVSTPTTVTSQVKESLITLGTGTNASTDYENVLTTQVYIDPSKYGNIKSVKFEVSIAVPTANQFVYVRLFNVTDNNPVWNSEMYMSGGPSSYLVSGPITLASGNKLYVVQIKSQLKALTNLNQARLRIETY